MIGTTIATAAGTAIKRAEVDPTITEGSAAQRQDRTKSFIEVFTKSVLRESF
jgi:hypothetical protein